MYYQVDEDNKITAVADYKFQPDAIFTEEEIAYSYDGRLIFKREVETEEYTTAKLKYENEKLLEELRYKRETECFPIINRGQLWRDSLTEEQRAELKEWYTAWLNVTETLKVPSKPKWLSN